MNPATLFQISYGLYVLSAKEGEKDNACIINTVMQVTDIPKRLVIAVNKSNLTHDMIQKSGLFNLSVLDQSVSFEVFEHFGFQSGRETDKFQDAKDCKRSKNGLYYLTKGSCAYISASVVSETDLGTHTLFLADILDGEIVSEKPAVTYTYYQEKIKPKPKKEEKTGYRCVICGYIYEGDELPPDFICPICKHGVDDFEKI